MKRRSREHRNWPARADFSRRLERPFLPDLTVGRWRGRPDSTARGHSCVAVGPSSGVSAWVLDVYRVGMPAPSFPGQELLKGLTHGGSRLRSGENSVLPLGCWPSFQCVPSRHLPAEVGGQLCVTVGRALAVEQGVKAMMSHNG